MTTFDSGQGNLTPAGALGVTTFAVPGGPVTASVEAHIGGLTGANPLASNVGVNNVNQPALGAAASGTGANPLPPSEQGAGNADASSYGTNITGNPVVALSTRVVSGVAGTTVRFVNPA